MPRSSRHTSGSRCSEHWASGWNGSPARTSTIGRPASLPGATLGASYAPGDGYIDAPRNVLAYTAALTAHGVDVRERCAFTGLRTAGGRVVGVDTSDGQIDTERVVLTGGPQLGEVGARAGVRIPAGGTRHQVVVTAPVPGADVYELPMVFDITSGIYWRPGESGGLLWGMSNPDEPPGVATDFDTVYYRKARDRIEELFPAVRGLGLRRAWAATIDYTPDHLPILGPLLTDDGPIDRHRRGQPGRPRHDVGSGSGPGGRRPDRPPVSARGLTSPTSASTDSTPTATAGLRPSRFPYRSRNSVAAERISQ